VTFSIVENLPALEFNRGAWKIYYYAGNLFAQFLKIRRRFKNNLDNDEIFKDLVNEFLKPKT